MTERKWAIEGFAQGDLYDAARPRYPEGAIDHLLRTLTLNERSRVLDLGAGTGIFTRHLEGRVGRIVAVDPSASMRETFRSQTPGVDILNGTADEIPLADHSVDAVVVAQAFHWFDPSTALPEIRRVLTPGGGLGLLWNRRDTDVDWIRQLNAVMLWDEHQPYDATIDFAGIVAAGPFEQVAQSAFSHHDRLTHDQILRRVATTSYITLMDDAQRQKVLVNVSSVVDPLSDPVEMPYVTSVVTAFAQ